MFMDKKTQCVKYIRSPELIYKLKTFPVNIGTSCFVSFIS